MLLTKGFTLPDHCIDTLSDYGPGRESCTDKTFCPRHGVLSGFVTFKFQRRSPGDTTLSELRQPKVLFKVGTLSYNGSTIDHRP